MIDDDFWTPRIEQVRVTSLPLQEHQLRTGGQFEALSLTWRPGDPGEPHIFWESDVAKWIEAASYSLAKHPDPQLDASVDEAIHLLAGAQQPDGYLNVYFTVVRPGERFTDLRDGHELYCAGHLMEAAAAHHAATGKTSLLEIARRYADLLLEQFSPGGPLEGGYDGHQEIELGLIKLSEATKDSRYRALARKMLEDRGTRPFYFEAEEERRGNSGYFGSLFPQRAEQAEYFREYNQTHAPVREQHDAVGHSVRAMYMYSAMADLSSDAEAGSFRTALESLWSSTTERRMYLTGGLGSDPSIEGFGKDFDLPLDTAYAETCAAVGLVFWAHRMAALTQEGRYIDVLERALFNGVLAGASQDGSSYFYSNPMRSRGDATRNPWFGVACCPPNFARLIQSLDAYAYTQTNETAFVNLFLSGSAAFDMAGHDLTVLVRSGYPWTGSVELTVRTAPPRETEIALRIPGWATDVVLLVNGVPFDTTVQSGYLRVRRQWQAGDVLGLSFAVMPRLTHSRPEVEASVGRVAIERGPIVYCVEGVDNGGDVALLSLARDGVLGDAWDEQSKTVRIVASGTRHVSASTDLYATTAEITEDAAIAAVPYYQWGNRGQSTMEVWIRED
ncbi:glycoside hydrolase family 127 protein [Rathayibacter festucae]|uniref:glycoside hydrolase family 127 protein n=1 Tax=Rathayibacter festucae TaxID=110937 RepID=UPI002A6A620F|nr:beta-L-arabinofuranosidase domain-containing protein [Rathayibacter festucae]MDY0914555.1 glycoside hydrolase family 127 protein [Rathayibacter festucae]